VNFLVKIMHPLNEKIRNTVKEINLEGIFTCLSKNTYVFHVRQEFHVFDQNSGIKPHVLTKFNFPFVRETRQYENIFCVIKHRTK
jgi:hypothetical protein